MHDGRAKLYLLWRALHLRKSRPELFQLGEHQPLPVEGPDAPHTIALARWHSTGAVVLVAPRWTLARLDASSGTPAWTAQVRLPEGVAGWENLLTGARLESQGAMELRNLWAEFPVAVLVST